MSSKVVDLAAFRRKTLAQKAFGPWRARFGEEYGVETRPADLSDRTLLFLATPGDESANAFYELILGALDLGPAPRFFYLDNEEQLRVVDIHLVLADLVRFELMRRIGWLKAVPASELPLVELIRRFEEQRAALRDRPPELAESHPGYEAYRSLPRGDREVFIRRLLREAIEVFRGRLEGS
ncbi:MAG: hypothetical protein WHT06_00815 [Desulfobacterales bacterium]